MGKKAPVIGYINDNRRLTSKMAPRAGFEPATCRLTVECSTAELPGIIRSLRSERVIQMPDRFAKRFLTKKCTKLDWLWRSLHLDGRQALESQAFQQNER